MKCQCSRKCKRIVKGKGKRYAKGHNPACHTHKHTKEYRLMMTKRNKSLKMRKVSITTSRKYIEDRRQLCITRNKTLRMRKMVSKAMIAWCKSHPILAKRRIRKGRVKAAETLKFHLATDKNYRIRRNKANKRISKALRKAYALGTLKPPLGVNVRVLKTLKAGIIKSRCKWENLFAQALDKSRKVKRFNYEPFSLKYKDTKGCIRSFIPDFLITFHDDMIHLVELVGWELQYKNAFLALNRKNLAAERFCGKKGYKYFCLTSLQEIRDYCINTLGIDLTQIKVKGRTKK